MKIVNIVVAAVAAAFLALPATAQSSCPSGMEMCGSPKTGGGCYRPGYAICEGGRTCQSGMHVCAAGPNGTGGCYRPGYAECHAGLICESGMEACAPGPNGPGGCFRPGYAHCEAGAVKSSGNY